MAASVDYNNPSPTLGIYGAYNRFIARMTAPSKVGGTDDKFKHSFRVRVTPLNDTSKEIVREFTSVKDQGVPNPAFRANVNPIEPLRSTFFGFEYKGISEFTSIIAYSGVQIEVGEVYTTDADTAPTFQGYDTDDTFYFHNGYEKDGDFPVQLLNYRYPNWYNTTPHLLPKVKKTLYLEENSTEFISIPSYLNIYPTLPSVSTNLKNLVTEVYNANGTLDSTSTIDLTARPDLSGVGYWNISAGVNPNLADGQYAEVYAQWVNDGGESGTTVDSERLTIRRLKCKPKDVSYRLKWINRYGGIEYETFQLHTDKTVNIKRGKKIASTGIDYNATSFADISNINDPNIREIENTAYTSFKLRTDWITQEQIDALQELFKSNKVTLALTTSFFTEHPVIVENTSYRILDVKQKLQRVEVNVRLANFEPNQI